MDTDRDLAAMQWVSELIFKTYIKVRDQDLYPDVRERVVSELWRDVLQLAKIEAQKFEPPQQGGALHPGEHPALPATSPATAPPPIAPPPIAPPPGAQPETAPGGRRAKRRNKDRGN